MAGSDAREAKMEQMKQWVFLVTFVNYAMAHWTRKAYTNVKSQMGETGVSTYTLALMDSMFMFTYAGGSFITGMLGDNCGAATVIAIGLLGSSGVLLMIWAGLIGGDDSIAASGAISLVWFASAQFIHGFFQATGGPVNTAIMNSWWPKKGRGKIFGFWTCHQYIGDIVAAFAGAYILSSGMDWRNAIMIPLVINFAWSLVNFYFLANSPEEVPELVESTAETTSLSTEEKTVAEDEDKPPSFMDAMKVAWNYALAFGFFKLINYAMFFQLPTILSANFDSSTANIISSLYSVGMMPGGIVCGWMSDIYGGKRACVCATMMVILIPLLVMFAFFMDDLDVYVLLFTLCLMGCLVGGPNNIITSAVSSDLADTLGKKATGTVTGIINGSGSVTAAFGQMAIPILFEMGKADGVNYRYVWLFLVVCTILGILLMWPKIAKELSEKPNEPEKSKYGAVPTTEMVKTSAV